MLTPLFALARRTVLGLAAVLLCSQCSFVNSMVNPGAVIYALAPQDDLPSPIAKTLTPVGQPISFSPNRYMLTQRQMDALKAQAAQWQKDKADTAPRLLVLGFTRRGLPSGYARVLAQRRAESARQILIEQGIDAARLHTAGYGHDQPGLSTGDEVRLFIVN